MNTSGEAADQIVRMSLEAGQAALKISGTGAKQLAVLLYAVLKEQKKTKGRAKLETLVRSGRPLTVFSIREADLKKFVQEAKSYGILYCVVRNRGADRDGMADIMVKEEDAPRINRIVERFKFASVSEAEKVKTEIEQAREEKGMEEKLRKKRRFEMLGNTKEKESTDTKETVHTEEKADNSAEDKGQPEGEHGTKETQQSQQEQERGQPEKSKEDFLVDELLGAPTKKDEAQTENPYLGRAAKSRQSVPISGRQSRTAVGVRRD